MKIVSARGSNLRLLGAGFKTALALWLLDAIAVWGQRDQILELYQNSHIAPKMATSSWVFFPLVMVAGLLFNAAIILLMKGFDRSKHKSTMCHIYYGVAFLGGIYFVFWSLQLVVDIRAL